MDKAKEEAEWEAQIAEEIEELRAEYQEEYENQLNTYHTELEAWKKQKLQKVNCLLIQRLQRLHWELSFLNDFILCVERSHETTEETWKKVFSSRGKSRGSGKSSLVYEHIEKASVKNSLHPAGASW